MKKVLILWFVLCATIFRPVMAQKIVSNFGSEFKVSGNTTLKLIGGSLQYYYVLEKISTGTFIENADYRIYQFDANQNNIKNTPIVLTKMNGNRLDLEDIVMLGGKLHVLCSMFDKKLDEKTYFVNSLDDQLNLTKYVELDKISQTKLFDTGDFDFYYSPDSTKIAILKTDPSAKNKSFGIKVFDADFNLLWQKNISLKQKSSSYTLEKALVSNTGKCYLLGSIREGMFKDVNADEYVLNFISNEEKEPTPYVFKQVKAITSLKIFTDLNNHLLAMGLYGEENKRAALGTILMKFDGSTNQVLLDKMELFKEDVLKEIHAGKKKRYKYGIGVAEVQDLLLKKDGGYMLMLEKSVVNKVTVYKTRYNPQTKMYENTSVVDRVDYKYSCDDIVIQNLSGDFTLKNSIHIPKNQYTINDGGYYNSFCYLYDNNFLHILFNETAYNFESKSAKKRKAMSNPASAVVSYTRIDENGNKSRSILFKNEEERMIAAPKKSKRIDAKNLMILAYSTTKDEKGFIKLLDIGGGNMNFKLGKLMIVE